MNRKLLTGLTLAGVAGTGGAAYASVAEPAHTTPPAASAGPLATAAETSTTAAATTTTAAALGRTISYQVGDAGTITVDVAGSVMTSRGLVPASGWNIGAMSNSATHVDVQFANTERIVGFSADLVGADVVVSVTNDRLPGAVGPVDPLVVSAIDESDASSTVPSPATAPSFDTVVPATPAPTPVTTPAPVAPPAASTSAPSSAGSHSDDDEYEGDDDGHSSHNDESEGGDDD